MHHFEFECKMDNNDFNVEQHHQQNIYFVDIQGFMSDARSNTFILKELCFMKTNREKVNHYYHYYFSTTIPPQSTNQHRKETEPKNFSRRVCSRNRRWRRVFLENNAVFLKNTASIIILPIQ